MVNPPPPSEPKKRYRAHGDDGISWDKINKCYVGTISLGFTVDGKRVRRTARGRTKAEVKNKLDELHTEIKAGIHTPATYTIEQCVKDWLDSIERDPHTMATFHSQAGKWIYPKIGATKLKDFNATDADRFFRELAKSLSKRSLMMIKSTLRRSIRRAQVHDLIGRNVVELIDLPTGQPGHPSRAMTEDQAAKVLTTASGMGTGYVKVVKASKGRYGATHAATEAGELACGTKPHPDALITEMSREPKETTCRTCRAQLGIDDIDDPNLRLEALFVLSVTLGLRPGELRKLTWDHVDLTRGVAHIWRSASKSGDTKTPKSKRSLTLPKRAIVALKAHKARQDHERLRAGEAWHDNNLVFCHENGTPYTSDQLNWRFSKMTRRAGIGHWHAHEGRHTAVSIMSSNGVSIQDISDTVGHKSTHVTETVYRHVIVPAIRGGATVMDDIFDDNDDTQTA
ncbi:tyrosine-type recombinase/integrase [Trebonia sp.]|uniref:tyrosine-type recombinase/integrase n=1 Tax=Trebonia sp. TaxID=2767075 RepID=UPI0026382A82|nr:tyrosine-type recombinase/integrase [Trebonia sp.]